MNMTSDERLKKVSDPARRSRAMDDRATTENRELSDDDRVQMFRDSFYQSALPDLPELPGYHVCWLTTTNPRDPVQGRFRLGYEPIKAEEVPGWEYATVKTGEYAGLIGVNEMIAAKLPMRLYHRLMREAHHDAPLREEERMVSDNDLMADRARGSKSRLVEEDGISGLREMAPEPVFDGR
jgi:hypothetical protein